MSEKQSKPGVVGRKFRLFLLIFVVLLVPMVMDQAELDRDSVRLAGRIAAGATLALLIWGIFAKLFRVFAFVLIALIGLVFLISEGHIKAPRLTAWIAERRGG